MLGYCLERLIQSNSLKYIRAARSDPYGLGGTCPTPEPLHGLNSSAAGAVLQGIRSKYANWFCGKSIGASSQTAALPDLPLGLAAAGAVLVAQRGIPQIVGPHLTLIVERRRHARDTVGKPTRYLPGSTSSMQQNTLMSWGNSSIAWGWAGSINSLVASRP